VDVICLQHEYGIFGGKRGSFIIELLRDLKMPVVTTLHTILNDPPLQERHILMQLAEFSDRLVVMSERSVEFLRDIYQVPEEKIVLIHHGIPDVPFVESDVYKDKFGVAGKQIILTFGLLSPGKGIDVVINALPEIVKDHPQVIYMVVGATHPHLKAEQGEDYRNSLYRRAKELGVSDHIVFHDRFVADEDLLEFIGAADIYVTPYQNEAQIISGTLAYALGMGKAVISTPYWHAQELLADGRGRLVPFRDPVALAGEVIDLLDHPDECRAIQERAYQYGRKMVWSNVGRRYLDTFAEAKRQRLRKNVPEHRLETLGLRQQQLPEIKLDYLRRMTDDTGMLQHAKYTVADRTHGYCVDDNARALIVAVTLQDLQPLDSMTRLAASATLCPMIAVGSRNQVRMIPTVAQCGGSVLRWRWVAIEGRRVSRLTCSSAHWTPSNPSPTRGPSPSPLLVSMPTCPATAGTAAGGGCARYFRTGSCSSSGISPPKTGPGAAMC
jgi:glycosyltransferase involved in cell wall biosynthesis